MRKAAAHPRDGNCVIHAVAQCTALRPGWHFLIEPTGGCVASLGVRDLRVQGLAANNSPQAAEDIFGLLRFNTTSHYVRAGSATAPNAVVCLKLFPQR
jgi:hypothetical protein